MKRDDRQQKYAVLLRRPESAWRLRARRVNNEWNNIVWKSLCSWNHTQKNEQYKTAGTVAHPQGEEGDGHCGEAMRDGSARDNLRWSRLSSPHGGEKRRPVPCGLSVLPLRAMATYASGAAYVDDQGGLSAANPGFLDALGLPKEGAAAALRERAALDPGLQALLRGEGPKVARFSSPAAEGGEVEWSAARARGAPSSSPAPTGSRSGWSTACARWRSPAWSPEWCTTSRTRSTPCRCKSPSSGRSWGRRPGRRAPTCRRWASRWEG